MLGVAALEMWNSAAMAFGIGPTLTMGAVEALDKHASKDLKAKYLAKLVLGEWMGDDEPDRTAGRFRSRRLLSTSVVNGARSGTLSLLNRLAPLTPPAPLGLRGVRTPFTA